MAGEAEQQESAPDSLRHWPDHLRQWWQRARQTPGSERHSLLLIIKSTLAATLAWLVSYYLLDAPMPAFAPFSAVLIMQVTVYQSLLQSLRYVAAVSVGVAMSTALGFMIGSDLLTFVVVAFIALTIGRWPALGPQGPQVATAAFFAFSTYALATSDSQRVTQLGQIILLVVIGCGIGVTVNLALIPPLRHRSAEHGVRSLSRGLYSLVSDLQAALRAGKVDQEYTRAWRQRAEQTGELITQARASFRTAEESLYYNPRRMLRRHRMPASFDGYGGVLEALIRCLHQVASLARSLDQWTEQEDGLDDDAFFSMYADYLQSVATAAELLGELREESLREQAKELEDIAAEAQERTRAVTEQCGRSELPLADVSRPYGVLVVEATRLTEEIRHTSEVLSSTC
ncbi:aromatic acid exporter family protein [Streptomyces sp. NPDC093510]|uniref:FUSC family protein n=1 Tax=Streptomyces sp. NPDC093510 TaxID=3155199 RepID=UPI00343C2C0E